MALTNCPECGKELSDKASTCIHCGANVVLCAECNRLVLAQKVCSYCGAPLSLEAPAIETETSAEQAKEKKGKNKLKLTNVQKEKVYQEINERAEVQEMKKKVAPYSLLPAVFWFLIGLIVVLGFRISFSHLSGTGRVIMLVFSGVAAIAIAIVQKVMSGKEKNLNSQIKKYFNKEYQAAIEEFKKDPSKIPTNEKEKTKEPETSTKLETILKCISWGVVGLFVLCLFLPLIKVGNEYESIFTLLIEFIDKVIIKKVDTGALLEYASGGTGGRDINIPNVVYLIFFKLAVIIVAIAAVIGFIINISLGSNDKDKGKKEDSANNEDGSRVEAIIESISYGVSMSSALVIIDGGLLIAIITSFFVFYDLNAMGYSISALAYIIPVFIIVCKLVIDIVCHIIDTKKMKECLK